MSTSRSAMGPSARPSRPSLKTLALEASGLAALGTLLSEQVGTGRGAVPEPHPLWIAVLLLATRHGTDGLVAGLIAGAGAVEVVSRLAGGGLEIEWSRLGSGANL